MFRSRTYLFHLIVVLGVLISCDGFNYPYKTILGSARKAISAVSDKSSAFSLPTDLKPTLYNLTLTPIDESTYRGLIHIMFDVVEETDSVILNVDNKTIDTSSWKVILASKNQNLMITEALVDGIRQTVSFRLNEVLLKQKGVVLIISYKARYSAYSPYVKQLGFFRVDYSWDEDATDNCSLAITQFGPTSARSAFPCFDDPKFRSVFQLNIYRLPNQVSLFNTRLVSSLSSPQQPLVLDVYEPSPPMPSYLVAFGVTDMGMISDGRKVRIFGRPRDLGNMTFALSVAQPALDALKNYTGIPYALEKMDIVAVYGKPGAMENWGLNTFGDGNLKNDPNNPEPLYQQETLRIIAHEFAHQWFGALVTCESFEYLWLNEGFATLLEYKIASTLYPEWSRIRRMWLKRRFAYSMERDVGNPRPMTSSQHLGNERKYFDYVSYGKSGAVLRMTEHFLSAPIWKKGLNIFLTKNKYRTVTPEKLFMALQEAAKDIKLFTVNETLQGWTRNPGYPLITVSKNITTEDGKVIYRISQEPYNLDDKSADYKWNVPLTFTTDKKMEFDPDKADRHWLYPSDTSTAEVAVDTTGWVLFNVGRVGYYRVNYEPENWRKLKDQLMKDVSVIPEESRIQLVDDVIHLILSEHLSLEDGKDFLMYLEKENANDPWEVFWRSKYSVNDADPALAQKLFNTTRLLYSQYLDRRKESD